MISHYFNLPNYSWNVYVFYNTDNSYDVEGILSMLQLAGVSAYEYTLAYTNMMDNTMDTGFCYSNCNNGISIIVIAKTSTPAQFMNSFIHETRHLERHIERTFHIDPFSEEAATLAGDIAEKMFDKAKLFLCKCYS